MTSEDFFLSLDVSMSYPLASYCLSNETEITGWVMFVDLKNIMQTGGLEPGYKKPLKSAVTTVKPTELLKPYRCNRYK